MSTPAESSPGPAGALPPRLACPRCHGGFRRDADTLRCDAGHAFAIVDGIPHCAEELAAAGSHTAQIAPWEALYRGSDEPWRYTDRAVERLRHQFTAELVARLVPSREAAVLDVGCSLGQLTEALRPSVGSVSAVDLSESAVHRAQARLASTLAPGLAAGCHFAVASSTGLPFAPASFDLVLFSDGLHSWKLTLEQRRAALAEAHLVAKPGAPVIFTDYMNPRLFDDFIATIEGGPLPIEAIHYLDDRAYYVLESTLKALRRLPPVRAFFASLAVGRGLAALSRRFGRRGSKHLCVVTRKPG